MFDNYSVKARLYPMGLMFLPVVVVGIAYSYQFSSLTQSIGSIGGTACLSFLLSQLGRDMGKKKEPNLWHGWGGAPTVQLLRLNNTVIDTHTKRRYHVSLKERCEIPELTQVQLGSYTELPDAVYQTWTKYLISKTRDTKAFSLLYKENVNYGFRRNLWGLKPVAVPFIVAVILSWYFVNTIFYDTYNPLMFPPQWFAANVALLVLLTFWIAVVTKNWVRIVAFAYAERLLEASGQLN
jgi:hypothetical protein